MFGWRRHPARAAGQSPSVDSTVLAMPIDGPWSAWGGKGPGRGRRQTLSAAEE